MARVPLPDFTLRMTKRLQRFFKNETTGGLIMIGFALLALIAANSPFANGYQHLIEYTLPGGMTAHQFVNDVLMAIFFLAVGMELKREMKQGFLSSARERTLPLIAAIGGIVCPALIYIAINHTVPEHANGWAIPTATDIAFAACVLALAGKHVPSGAKIFLLAIAIYDDLAAILIIAIFYSSGIAVEPLLIAAGTVAVMYHLNQGNRAPLWVFLALGAVLWHYVHAAGIHTTIAGMITGLMIPFEKRHHRASMLEQFLHQLHPFVTFGVLPAFAFVSAGVSFTGITLSNLTDTLPLGIALGLFFGKQIGIFGATYAAVKLGFAARPKGATWSMIYGVAIIAGIGFTMSLFIGFLAFRSPELHSAIKLGVFGGSLASAIFGACWLRWQARRHS